MLPDMRPAIALVDTDGCGVTTNTEQLDRKGYKAVDCRWGSGLYDMAVCERPDLLIVDIDAAAAGTGRAWRGGYATTR